MLHRLFHLCLDDQLTDRLSTGIGPDEDLMLGMDHDAWRELGVNSGILRAKILDHQRERLLMLGTEFKG